jgi:hypothetical protein
MKTAKRKQRKSPNMHGAAVQAKHVTVHVTQGDIDAAECGKPTKCMIKVALKRALNLAHGYIHVDATGVSISRNCKYREKAFMPRPALINMLKFDKGKVGVKPFTFKLHFVKTTPIADAERAASTRRAKQKERAKQGFVEKKYDMRSRVVGVALSGGVLVAA